MNSADFYRALESRKRWLHEVKKPMPTTIKEALDTHNIVSQYWEMFVKDVHRAGMSMEEFEDTVKKL